MGYPVVVCAKDKGAFSVVAPLALRARASGCDVRVVTEGLAGAEFEKIGFTPDHKGSVDANEERSEFDAITFLSRFREAVVVIGESSSSYLESALGQAAAKLGSSRYPVVECQDSWGGHLRLRGVRPSLVLTLDEYGRELVLKNLELSDDHVVVVGNVGARKVLASEKVRSHYESLRSEYDRVFYYAGGGSYTSHELDLILECLKMTPGRNIVVCGFHPKRVVEYGDEWRAITNREKESFVEAEPNTGEGWASLTTTLSGFSTLLTTAVFNGQIAISLKTPATMASLKRQNGLDEVPHVSLGCAYGITRAQDLSSFREIDGSSELVTEYDPELAWKAVTKFFL